ncbi:MAG: hypothetical protein MZV63_26135 [Marinilabiliales bacterium]|nr:hypothetical protein [Marinilabiliales bacterium]
MTNDITVPEGDPSAWSKPRVIGTVEQAQKRRYGPKKHTHHIAPEALPDIQFFILSLGNIHERQGAIVLIPRKRAASSPIMVRKYLMVTISGV